MDYHYYLPVFCDGIRENKEPHCAIALMGVYDLLAHGQKKVLPVIPQLILPLKSKQFSPCVSIKHPWKNVPEKDT